MTKLLLLLLCVACSSCAGFGRLRFITPYGTVEYKADPKVMKDVSKNSLTMGQIVSTEGIAARYPGDKGIASDPAVIFADDFESYSQPSQLTNKWNAAYRQPNLRIVTGGPSGKAIEMRMPIGSSEISNALVKRFPGEDVVFIRSYQKFDASYEFHTSNHNGMRLSSRYPGPAIQPTNSNPFYVALKQNNIIGSVKPGEMQPGYTHIYAYWLKQLNQYGDHWYPTGLGGPWLKNITTYPDFKPLPQFLPQRDRWYCDELMLKANTPGKSDGEVAYWINGVLAGRFPNLNLRNSNSAYKVDEAHIVLHAHKSARVNRKWYDQVVIARSYIGPIAP